MNACSTAEERASTGTWQYINSLGVLSHQLRRGVIKTTHHPVIEFREDDFQGVNNSRHDQWIEAKENAFRDLPSPEDVNPETIFMPIETLTKLYG